MIPRTIHYCWFGDRQPDAEIERCMATWREVMPDYEIHRWDETNSPLDVDYCRHALELRAWSRLTNYVRLWALERQGGIYLDTDIEVVRRFDPLLASGAFLGFQRREEVPGWVNNAVFGAQPGHPFLSECLEATLTAFRERGELAMSPHITTQRVAASRSRELRRAATGRHRPAPGRGLLPLLVAGVVPPGLRHAGDIRRASLEALVEGARPAKSLAGWSLAGCVREGNDLTPSQIGAAFFAAFVCGTLWVFAASERPWVRRLYLTFFFIALAIPGLAGGQRWLWPFQSWHLWSGLQPQRGHFHEVLLRDAAGQILIYDRRAIPPLLDTQVHLLAQRLIAAPSDDPGARELASFLLGHANQLRANHLPKLAHLPKPAGASLAPLRLRLPAYPEREYGRRWSDAELATSGPFVAVVARRVSFDFGANGRDVTTHVVEERSFP